jgi:hypothetical protein
VRRIIDSWEQFLFKQVKQMTFCQSLVCLATMQFLTIANAESVFRLLKPFGITSFTVVKGKSVTKPLDVFCSLAELATGLALLISSIIYSEDLKTGKSDIVDVGAAVSCVGALAIDIIAVGLTFAFRHDLWNIVLSLRKVDEIFSEHQFVGENKKFKRRTAMTMLLFISLSPPIVFLVYSSHGSVIKAIVYLYSGLYYILLNLMTAVFISSIYLRLNSITKLLDLCWERERSVQHEWKCDNRNTKVYKSMIEVYNTLMDTFHIINSCYGILMMLGMSLIFFFTIFTLFMTYKDIANGTVDGITIASILFAAYLTFFTIATIDSSVMTEREAQNVLRKCSDILKRSTNAKEIALIVALSSSIMRRPPKFSCGLFDFDLKIAYGVSEVENYKIDIMINVRTFFFQLLSQMLATTSSNFIILMQFDMASQQSINDTAVLNRV